MDDNGKGTVSFYRVVVLTENLSNKCMQVLQAVKSVIKTNFVPFGCLMFIAVVHSL